MKHKHLLLSLLSALLLSLPWFEAFSGLLLLVAFAPLLVVENDFAQSGKKGFWKYAWLTVFVWNAATTWWIFNATAFGMLFAFVGNSAQMLLVLWLFHVVKKHTNRAVGYTAFVALWLAWEWFYFDAEISWPWLTLGNGFAKDIALVQWYEITGALGGSLWALLCNVSTFFILEKIVKVKEEKRKREKENAPFRFPVLLFSFFTLLLVLPIGYSLIRFYTYKEETNPCKVLILQPNIDPFNDKFGGLTQRQQQDIILAQADSGVTAETDYVIAPETAMEGGMWENSLPENRVVRRLKEFCAKHPNANFVTGAVTFHLFDEGEEIPPTARRFNDAEKYYEGYNAALQVDSTDSVQVYHKSKLVVGVEMLPYPRLLKFVGKLAINLGGTSGGLGTQKEREAFTSVNGKFRAGTAICYESIYGQFFTEYVKKGANIMLIITNDGWWKNTPGHRQHLRYASLRAIETRRSIARSGNTGISAVINQRGEIEQRTAWWVRTSITGSINANEHITPYVRHGDIIGRIAGLLTLLILCYALAQRLLPKMLRRE
jgi:apolipoprotein N-acyltransferase